MTQARSFALERLVAAPPAETLLVTDFDGTLAPIVADPPAAAGLPESLHALGRLAELGVRVVVLSGRPTSFLEAHVPIPGVRLLGDNGLEQLSAGEAKSLESFKSLAGVAIGRRPGIVLASTPGCVAVHYRAAPQGSGDLFEELSNIAAGLDLLVSPGRMVVEIRPRRGTKVRAVDRLIQQLQPACVVFAGDDEGDRDAFGLVSRFDGVHVAIGILSDETKPDLFRSCDIVFDNPASLAAFLTEWVNGVGIRQD